MNDNVKLDTTHNGKIVFEIFPEEYRNLDKELRDGNHPKLTEILSQVGAEDIDMKLAQISSYCEVVMDGDYTLKSRMALCKILTQKLILLREDERSQSIIQLS